MSNNNELAFIIELEALSRKYNLIISGCGCCGSPFIEELEDKELQLEAGYANQGQLRWVSPTGYYWKDESEHIVKELK